MTADDTAAAPPLDLARIGRALAGRISAPLTLQLLGAAGGDHATMAEQLSDLTRTVVGAAPDLVSVDHSDPESEPVVRPALRLTRPGCGSIDYAALPAGPELEPFIEAVTGEAKAPVDDAAGRALGELAQPAHLSVFIAESCPHCPHAVRAAVSLALASPAVRCSVIDAQRFESHAASLHVRSVPVTFLDDGLSLAGITTAAQLAAHLTGDAPSHAVQRLRSMVEGGRLDHATARLVAGDADAFAGCWRESTTSLRVGLLLVVEEALEQDPASLDAAVERLLPLLERGVDPALRGDTVDLLGQIAASAAKPALAALVDDPDADIAEAASDGVEAIARRRAQAGTR